MASMATLIHFVISVFFLWRWEDYFSKGFSLDRPFETLGLCYSISAVLVVGYIGYENLILPFFKKSPIGDTLKLFSAKTFTIRKAHATLHSIASMLSVVFFVAVPVIINIRDPERYPWTSDDSVFLIGMILFCGSGLGVRSFYKAKDVHQQKVGN